MEQLSHEKNKISKESVLIDGFVREVDVDWSLFDADKINQPKQAIKGFLRLNYYLQTMGGIVVGEYINSKTPIKCIINKIEIIKVPDKFRDMYYNIEKIKKDLDKNGDRFLEIINFGNSKYKNVQINIFTKDNSIITITTSQYPKFANSRDELIEMLSKINGKLLSSYKNNTETVIIKIDDSIIDSITPDNFKRQTYKSILKFFNKIRDNNYKFIKFVEYNQAGIKALVENNGYSFTIDVTSYNADRWKGGVTDLYEHLRHRIDEWKIRSFRKTKNACEISGIIKQDNVVHHLHNFNDIMLKTLEKLDLPIYHQVKEYTPTQLKSIEKLCLELHFEYGLGVVLTQELHKEFHKIYGYGKNTAEQFEEFKKMKKRVLTNGT